MTSLDHSVKHDDSRATKLFGRILACNAHQNLSAAWMKRHIARQIVDLALESDPDIGFGVVRCNIFQTKLAQSSCSALKP